MIAREFPEGGGHRSRRPPRLRVYRSFGRWSPPGALIRALLHTKIGEIGVNSESMLVARVGKSSTAEMAF